MEITIDIDSVCRICLKDGELKSIHHNFENSTYIEKINNFFNYEIILNSQVPDKICHDCIFLLNSACKFKSQVEETEDLLKKNLDSINDHNYDDTAGAVAVLSEDSNDYKIHDDDNVDKINDEEKLKIDFISADEIKLEDLFDDDDDDDDDVQDNYYEETNETSIDNLKAGFHRMMTQDKLKLKQSREKVLDFLKSKQFVIQPSRRRKIKTDTDITGEQNVEIKKPVKRRRRKSITSKKEPKAPIICEICGNKYDSNYRLEYHKRIHTGYKPYSCEVCGKTFSESSSAKRHMRVHTKEKPYACTYCDRKFSDYGSRIKHERTHTGERPYQCSECGMAFAYSYVLKNHMRIHTGLKPYECEFCFKKFSAAHHLKCHLNTHLKK